MNFRMLCILAMLAWCWTAAASEPAYDGLPPELVKLQQEGRLTVRALWAWKLVPESTAKMALELRAQGLDLLAADHAAVASWLTDADAGKLALSGEQRSFLEDLAARMQPESKEPEAPVATGTAVGQAPDAVSAQPDTSGGMSGNASLPELLAGLETGDADPGAKVSLALAVRAEADPVRSVALLEEAAAAGDADAMALLADEYESGLWVPRDEARAAQLRRQAADAGSQLAKWGLE